MCASAVFGTALLVLGLVGGSVRFDVCGGLILLGGGLNVWNAMRGSMAVRADERGVVLAPPTLRGRVPAPIPWPEVQSLIAFKHKSHSKLGVVKRNAGIPPASHTPGGLPSPDVSLHVISWKLDLPALAAAVHVHAPDIDVFDERALTSSAAPLDPRQRRRRFVAVGVGLVLFGGLLGALAANSGSGGPSGYTVQAGPAGQAVAPALPSQLGETWSMQSTDPGPPWKYYPSLLPGSPTSAYSMATGDYFSSSAHDISVDVVYASESADGAHRGVFSLSPSALVTLVNSAMYIPDARPFDAGPNRSANGTAAATVPVMECGTYVESPQCVWADDSLLVIVTYSDEPGTLQALAAAMPAIVQDIAGGG